MNYQYSKAVGKNLSTIRQLKGLTQEQLSAKLQVIGCDITRSALAKIEVGQRHLYPDEIKALKTVLEIRYEDLFV
jgi:Helix-turn-helix.